MTAARDLRRTAAERPLRSVMEAVLDGWPSDLPLAWAAHLYDVRLGFADMDETLTLEPWEPVFPARRGKRFPGAPAGAHMFRAFEGIAPEAVRVVVLGQDPYPCPAFSTGRAFEAGNVASWRELDKMVSVSVRTVMQWIAASRTGDTSLARSTADWASLLAGIEEGRFDIEPAGVIADRWVSQGVLLLNSALTLTRFAVSGDPHQLRGHLPLWRPFVSSVLRVVAERRSPCVVIAFGAQAADTLASAGLLDGTAELTTIQRDHPARGDEVLSLPNPFDACNEALARMGEPPVSW